MAVRVREQHIDTNSGDELIAALRHDCGSIDVAELFSNVGRYEDVQLILQGRRE